MAAYVLRDALSAMLSSVPGGWWEPLARDVGIAAVSVGAGLFYLFHSTNFKRVGNRCAGQPGRGRADDRTVSPVSCFCRTLTKQCGINRCSISIC